MWFRAALLREPENPFDKNAIAVHATGVGLIGYLDRQAALDYAPVFDELASQGYSVGTCPALLVGGEGTSCSACRRRTPGHLRAPPHD